MARLFDPRVSDNAVSVAVRRLLSAAGLAERVKTGYDYNIIDANCESFANFVTVQRFFTSSSKMAYDLIKLLVETGQIDARYLTLADVTAMVFRPNDVFSDMRGDGRE